MALTTTSAEAEPAPPQATQSQTQSAPPCSDAPVLKRGTQPDPPPCTEPAQAESDPADSAPPPSLPPNAPLIERAREATFQFSKKLPNFICQEFMSRFTQQGREEKVLQDFVSAEIIYEDGEETYRNVKVNNRPTNKRLQDIDGSWSTGEFASALLDGFLIPLRGRNSVPAVRQPLRVCVPRFMTFKCAVNIRTGSCPPALRL